MNTSCLLELRISFRQRLLIILNLCLAISLLLIYAAQPFMGEYFSLRSRLLIYEYALGSSPLLRQDPDLVAKLDRNSLRFRTLPQVKQDEVLQDYQHLISYATRPMLTKINDGIRLVLFGIPPFEFAWIVFSIVISILLLLQKPGAKLAVWILPLLSFLYIIDNQFYSRPRSESADASLFPSEEVIVKDYLSGPLKSGVLEQRDQLRFGWENYLLQHWTPKHEIHAPQTSAFSRSNAVEQAEYFFNLARLDALRNDPYFLYQKDFNQKAWVPWLILFFIWNIYFAANFRLKKSEDRVMGKT